MISMIYIKTIADYYTDIPKPRGFTAMNWEYFHLGKVRKKP